jgi:hypothetical protein
MVRPQAPPCRLVLRVPDQEMRTDLASVSRRDHGERRAHSPEPASSPCVFTQGTRECAPGLSRLRPLSLGTAIAVLPGVATMGVARQGPVRRRQKGAHHERYLAPLLDMGTRALGAFGRGDRARGVDAAHRKNLRNRRTPRSKPTRALSPRGQADPRLTRIVRWGYAPDAKSRGGVYDGSSETRSRADWASGHDVGLRRDGAAGRAARP